MKRPEDQTHRSEQATSLEADRVVVAEAYKRLTERIEAQLEELSPEMMEELLQAADEILRKENLFRVRQQLRRAGLLATDLGLPEIHDAIPDDELETYGVLFPDSRTTEELIDDERGN